MKGSVMKILNVSLFSILLILLIPAFVHGEPINPDDIRVIDGDTIDARGFRWRMIGYDTPEIRSQWRRVVTPQVRALGKRATVRFRELLYSGPLDLTELPCSCPPRDVGTLKCNHGRKCGLLTLKIENIGDQLIIEGLAKPFVCGPTRCPPMPKWP
jgi:endonuclease YncB( thermonuclease family)